MGTPPELRQQRRYVQLHSRLDTQPYIMLSELIGPHLAAEGQPPHSTWSGYVLKAVRGKNDAPVGNHGVLFSLALMCEMRPDEFSEPPLREQSNPSPHYY